MYLAIDIGGTKTLIALFSSSGRVLKKTKFKTARGLQRFLDDLNKNLLPFRKRRIKCVVVAIPGTVQKNYLARLGNRHNWGLVDLKTPIKNLFNCPIYLENDANLATIYESRGIRGKTIFLTFSTGVGGGIAENGKLSAESAKFEPGHKLYTYNERTLEWEDIAAASAIEKAFHVDVATSLRGRKSAEEIARRIGLGIIDLDDRYAPDTIIIGGPLGKIFKRFARFLPKIKAKYRRPRRPLESVIYGCYIFGKNQK